MEKKSPEVRTNSRQVVKVPRCTISLRPVGSLTLSADSTCGV